MKKTNNEKMKKSLYATLIFLTTLNASTPIPDYKSQLREIKPRTILKQLTNKKIANTTPADTEQDDVTYKRIKHNKATYHVVRISKEQKNHEVNIKVANPPSMLEDLVTKETIAAINGSFIREGQVIGLVRAHNENVTPAQRIRGSGYFTIQNGEPSIKKEIENIEEYEAALQSFPLLIYEGELTTLNDKTRSYRSAIGKDEEKNLYLIATDTHPLRRNKVTLSELAEFLQEQNITKALNLDGGRSAQLYIGHQVYNHREIPNAITITRKHEKYFNTPKNENYFNNKKNNIRKTQRR